MARYYLGFGRLPLFPFPSGLLGSSLPRRVNADIVSTLAGGGGEPEFGDELTGFSHHLGTAGKPPDHSLVVLATAK